MIFCGGVGTEMTIVICHNCHFLQEIVGDRLGGIRKKKYLCKRKSQHCR